jgi:hypothetical protein
MFGSGSPVANHKRQLAARSESLHDGSGCGWWIEFCDPALEGLLEVRIVLLGMLADKLDDLAIAVRGADLAVVDTYSYFISLGIS